jgi:hypothetical protein
MVYSGLRFARAAAEAGKPIAAVNLGRTRADELFCLKVEAPCVRTLETLAAALLSESRSSSVTPEVGGIQKGETLDSGSPTCKDARVPCKAGADSGRNDVEPAVGGGS